MKRKYLVTLLTILLLVAVALPVGAQTIWQTYGNIRAKALDVLGASTLRGVTTIPSGGTLTVDSGASLSMAGYVTSTVTSLTTSALTVNGNAAITGTGVVTGNLTAGSFLVLAPATNIAMTEGSTITPTGTYQGLTATYALGTSSIATKPAGTLLRLVNLSANAITITDTATISLSGNIALGQYDSLLLMSDGTGWIMMGTSNN